MGFFDSLHAAIDNVVGKKKKQQQPATSPAALLSNRVTEQRPTFSPTQSPSSSANPPSSSPAALLNRPSRQIPLQQMGNQAQTAIKDYFKPTPTIRARDLVRETPASIGVAGKEVGKIAKSTARDIARSVPAIGGTVYNALGGKQTEVTPKSGLEKLVFGTEPIRTLKGAVATHAPEIQKATGLNPTASKLIAGAGFAAGTVGNFIPGGGEAKPALEAGVSDVTKKYLSELGSAAKSAGETGGVRGATATVKSFLKDIKTKFVDSAAPIEDVLSAAEKRGKFKVLPTQDIRLQIDRVLRAPTLAGQFAKDHGLADVIKQAPDLHALDQYLIAKQSAKVAANGIETGRDLTRDTQLVKELAPTYEPLAKQVTNYSQKLLDYATESGLVGKDAAKMLKEKYPDYVPLNRIFSEEELARVPQGVGKGVASLSKQTIVQRLKGSEREIQSPIQSMLEKTNDAFRQGEKNVAAKQLAGYRNLPGFKDLIREMQPGESAPHTISYLDNGAKKMFEVTPELATAAKSLDKQQLGLIEKAFSYPTRLLRAGATSLNVGFTGANLAKDQLTAFVNSDRALKTSPLANPGNFLKALYNAAGHGAMYDDLVRSAAGGTSFDIGREQALPTIEKIRSGRNLASKVLYTVKHPQDLLRTAEDIIGRTEEATRLQQFGGTKEALLKEGRTAQDATLLAAKSARENTVNFARQGDWSRVLNATIPFFNAGVQGSRTFLRNLSEKPAQTTAKLVIGAFTPVAYTTFWNLSDPTRKAAYEDIPEYERKNNLIIIPPNPTQDAQGRWNVIKIPLSQEVASLADMVRRPIEASQGLDPVRFGEMAAALIQTGTSLDVSSKSAIASQLTPQAIKPELEGYTNTNLFTGAPIVPESLKSLPPEYQAKPTTSGTAQLVGKALKVSPLKIENAASTGLGGLGRTLLNASDQALATAGAIPKEQVGGQNFLDAITSRFSKARGGNVQNKQYEALNTATQESAQVSAQAKQKATVLFNSLKDMPETQRVSALKAMEADGSLDKQIYDQYKTMIANKGLTTFEKSLKGADTSARAKILYDELHTLPTEQRVAKLKDYEAKKILTKDVYDKYLGLIKAANIQ